MPQPSSIKPTMRHLIADKPIQILAIDFTVLEPAHGKENVLVMTACSIETSGHNKTTQSFKKICKN